MGITAENVAKKYQVSRQDQDALAVESHRRASAAIDRGYFKAQIVPVEVKVKREKVPFVTDEGVRRGSTVEKLARLPTVFDAEGTVTAGNASSINDAAAVVVLADSEYANRRGLKPMGRLVDYAYSGVDPKYMGIGPVPAVQKLLEKTGFGIKDIDVFEVNEAFAAQALAVCRVLEFPAERTNPNGSGISLGHPIGATGAILTVKALYELARTGGQRALVTMCIGGGQGIAAIFEQP
jgi:acetyl-CoA C-acetyltransferase